MSRSCTISVFLLASIFLFSNCVVFTGYEYLYYKDGLGCSYRISAFVSPASNSIYHVRIDYNASSCNPYYGLGYWQPSTRSARTNASDVEYPYYYSLLYDLSEITNFTATRCDYFPQTVVPSKNMYMCQSVFFSMYFYVEIFTTTTNGVTTGTEYAKNLIPVFTGNATQGNILQGYPNITLKYTFYVHESCNSTGSVISALNNSLYVYDGNIENLGLLSGMYVKYIRLKVGSGLYTTIVPTTQFYLWNSTSSISTGKCYGTGIRFGQFIPTFATCTGGCTFILYLSDSYGNLYPLYFIESTTNSSTTTTPASSNLNNPYTSNPVSTSNNAGGQTFTPQNSNQNIAQLESKGGGEDSTTTIIVMAVVIPVGVLLITVIIILGVLYHRSKRQPNENQPKPSAKEGAVENAKEVAIDNPIIVTEPSPRQSKKSGSASDVASERGLIQRPEIANPDIIATGFRQPIPG